MSQSLTRRGLVAAAPAAIVAATIPAIAAGVCSPVLGSEALDAELLALREPWLATLADFNAALDRKSRIDEQVYARTGAYPDFKTWTGGYDSYAEAHRKVTAAREALEAELGGDDADRMEDVTGDAASAVVERIEVLPARTLAGLAFKVEVSEDENHGRPELIDSIMADIKALAKGGLNA